MLAVTRLTHMQDPYIIRPAEVSDFDAIVPLVNEAYWNQQRNFFTDTPLSRQRISLDDLKKIQANPNQKLMVLFDKTKNAVSGVILLDLPLEKPHAQFGLFALDSSCRGKNLGCDIVKYVEGYAREHQRTFMKIEVFVFAPKLKAHYESLGYASTKKIKPFFHSSCIQTSYQNAEGRYLEKMRKAL